MGGFSKSFLIKVEFLLRLVMDDVLIHPLSLNILIVCSIWAFPLFIVQKQQTKDYMKKYLLSVCAGLSLLLSSCDDNDGYSLGDMAVDWVTVHDRGEGLYTYTGDRWGTMWPAAAGIFGPGLEDGQRAILYFNPLADNFSGYDVAIKPEYIRPFLTKDVEELTAENEDEYANHPTYLKEAWVAADYLHIQFVQKLPQGQPHRVSLVHPAGEPMVASDGYIHLEYRYNSYGDTLQVTAPALVCYRLQSLPLEEAKGVKVMVNDARKGFRELVFDKSDDGQPHDMTELAEIDPAGVR